MGTAWACIGRLPHWATHNVLYLCLCQERIVVICGRHDDDDLFLLFCLGMEHSVLESLSYNMSQNMSTKYSHGHTKRTDRETSLSFYYGLIFPI